MAGYVKKKPVKVNKHLKGTVPESELVVRVRLPKAPETLGIIEQRLGGNRMRVTCLDGKKRICRIPGRLKRRLWVRENDYCIVEPWEFTGDEKGDIVYKYTFTQVDVLRKKGHLKQFEELEEF